MNAHNQKRLNIWNGMTPAQRDYDRLVAKQIPVGASWNPELPESKVLEDKQRDPESEYYGCYCHRIAPCGFCESLTEEEADIYWNMGIDAVKKHREAKNL